MRTIYLKGTKKAITADLKKVCNYDGEIEYTNGQIYVHYIGDIMITQPIYNDKFEVITPPTFVGSEHCNVLVSDDFDTSFFNTLTSEPSNPQHRFGI